MDDCQNFPIDSCKLMHRLTAGKKVVQCLILLMLIFGMLHFGTMLLRVDCPAVHSMGGSNVGVISIVVPYASWNRSVVIESIERWKSVGSPCKINHFGTKQPYGSVQLIFYVNGAVSYLDRRMVATAVDILGRYASCFSNIGVIGAELTNEEDTYPAGPSNMFFKVFQDERLQKEFQSSSYMFWMEHDVYPLRPFWLDFLVQEAAKGDFWISGSVYLGDGLNDAVNEPDNWNWIGHINGNALYNLKDHAFREFLRLVVQYEPPSHFWKPFDVSIWRVVHAFPYTWPLYQKYRSKFVHSGFINHWGFYITSLDLNFSNEKPDVFFVHGTPLSAGNLLLRPKAIPPGVIWNDRVPQSAALSIMLSSFGLDFTFALEASFSINEHVPDVLEIVIVVLSEDVPRFQQHFGHKLPKVRIIGENTTYANFAMKEAWAILHADLFCRGELILHIDADAVLNRELRLRDLLWLGKPMLVYRKSDSGAEEKSREASTSLALGIPVHHDFTRGPLHVLPRNLYVMARENLENVTQANVSVFLRERLTSPSLKVNSSWDFDSLDYLGAYAWRFGQNAVALVPVDPQERRKLLLPPPVIKSPLCKGNARLANTQERSANLLKSLRDVWTDGLPCHRVLKLE